VPFCDKPVNTVISCFSLSRSVVILSIPRYASVAPDEKVAVKESSDKIIIMKDEFISDDVKSSLKKAFKQLGDTVTIEVYTQMGTNDPFNEATVSLAKAMSGLSDKLRVSFYNLREEQAKKRRVKRSPTVLIAPDKYAIRYTGSPTGEEAASFVLSLIMASTGRTYLTDDSRKRLERLTGKRVLDMPHRYRKI
jgi:hypothetical protein